MRILVTLGVVAGLLFPAGVAVSHGHPACTESGGVTDDGVGCAEVEGSRDWGECDEANCCDSDRGRQPAPWRLPQPGLLQRLGITMGGWLQQGITFNGDRPGDDYNGPVATNDLDAEYQMNQLWLYFDRPINTAERGWDIGGRIDMLYGTDFRFGINPGLENRINDLDRGTYGMVIPQLYLEVGIGDLSVKFGHFAAILDYELIPAPPNPFYSHSYSYGYTVPQLVTGFLADYKVTEQWSVQAGLHRGWMMFEDTNEDLDFMGGVKWVSSDKRTSVAFALSTGAQDPLAVVDGVAIGDWNGIPGDQERFVYSLVFQHQLTDRFRYVAVHNLGYEDNAVPTPGGLQDGEWYGLNQYFLYQINPKWAANFRFEWLRDDDGARIAGPGNIPGVRAWNGVGFAGSFYALTCGVTWRPTLNWMVRPEIRWDWYDGLPGPRGLPFDNGSDDDQFLFAVDVIFLF